VLDLNELCYEVAMHDELDEIALINIAIYLRDGAGKEAIDNFLLRRYGHCDPRFVERYDTKAREILEFLQIPVRQQPVKAPAEPEKLVSKPAPRLVVHKNRYGEGRQEILVDEGLRDAGWLRVEQVLRDRGIQMIPEGDALHVAQIPPAEPAGPAPPQAIGPVAEMPLGDVEDWWHLNE
jgi:hypothetical protein